VPRVALRGLRVTAMTPIPTLYVSPARRATPDLPYLTRVMFPLAR
jgi:hypothetical protein